MRELIILLLCCVSLTVLTFKTEEELQCFLEDVYETNISHAFYEQIDAEWQLVTDISNPDKQQNLVNTTIITGHIEKYFWREYFRDLKESDYESEYIQRQVKLLKVLGPAALDDEKLANLSAINANMTNVYSSAKICPFNKKECDLATEGLTLEPGIAAIITTSTNYDELAYVWKAWRDATGAKMKKKFNAYVELSNEVAKANGFSDKSELWMYGYETPTFEEDMEALWQQVKPLYIELHKYVSSKLKKRYGDAIDLSDGLIPAHVLGNMWAQSWDTLYDLVEPYPDARSIDLTSALKNNNFTVLKMFDCANEFYTSLGLEDCSIFYDGNSESVIERPMDREILCHPSAWDFQDGETYRIKMCTDVNSDYFVTIHHELGHIQYFLLYKDQPVTFRRGANPGFHEAIGDTIALSAAIPKHLEKIGLLGSYQESDEFDINTLMRMALRRVAFLPFGYLIDKWRWDIFSGKVTPDKYNSHWWKYRKEIQMVKPPVERSDETDFDAGSKFHVASDSQFINYFVSRILEFQLYRGLCLTAGEYDPTDPDKPLHRCDFYNNLEAGQKLRDGLSLGASKHWKEVLNTLVDEDELDASAILEYFQPLYDYLVQQNEN